MDISDSERHVGICKKHWLMHSDDDEWRIHEHVRPRSQSFDDDGPICAIKHCRERRAVGYVIHTRFRSVGEALPDDAPRPTPEVQSNKEKKQCTLWD